MRKAGLVWGVFLAGLAEKAQVYICTFDFSVVGMIVQELC